MDLVRDVGMQMISFTKPPKSMIYRHLRANNLKHMGQLNRGAGLFFIRRSRNGVFSM
jgi:hypothetical protein